MHAENQKLRRPGRPIAVRVVSSDVHPEPHHLQPAERHPHCAPPHPALASTPPLPPSATPPLPAAMSSPRFWSQPIRYLRWASHEKPAIFYSILVGLAGPATIVVVPPFRRLIGDEPNRPKVPQTYPSKSKPRNLPRSGPRRHMQLQLRSAHNGI